MTAASGSPLDPVAPPRDPSSTLKAGSRTNREVGGSQPWSGPVQATPVSRLLAASGRARTPPLFAETERRGTETETSLMPTMDIAITFPGQGQIRLESRALFEEPGNETCRQFLERVFQAPEITDVTINSHQKAGESPHADLRFCHQHVHASRSRAEGLHCLDPARTEPTRELCRRRRLPTAITLAVTERPTVSADGHPSNPDRNGHSAEAANGHARPTPEWPTLRTAWRSPRSPRSATRRGQVRFFRYGSVVTNWEIKHEIPGRLRLKNPVIHRKAELCQAIERELMSVLGVDYYKTSPLTSTVLVQYDPKELTRDQIIEILDGALAAAEHPAAEGQARSSPSALHGLGAAGRGRPVRRARRSCPPPRCSSPTRRSPPSRARARCSFEEKRLGVDVLDAIVVVGCLATDVDLPRRGALLVPGLRPRAGQEDAGQFQEAALERLRQAAPFRLALSRRRRGPGLARPARRPAT